MASATVRISVKSKETLQKLAEQTGKKMQTVLDEAVESYRRQRLLEEANAAFAALRADKGAWEAEQEERAAWDVTLGDGLKHA
jgi:predicted transcriptional regulator